MEQTLVLLKPDVVQAHNIGKVISVFEENGFLIKKINMEHLTREKAADFYEIHRGKEFYERLLNFMVSAPIVEMLIEGEDCVKRVRALVGETDPSKAAPGTIRRMFGTNVTVNGIHASDSLENARREIEFVFGIKEPV